MSKKVYCKSCGNICTSWTDGDIERQKCSNCGFIYYQNPFPCVSVLVNDDQNRVLLGLRGKDSIYPDQWCLPCGYIEYQETYLEAAVRETKEETGIEVEPLGIINVVSNQFQNGVNSIVVVLQAKPVSTKVIPGDDIVDARWFSMEEELPELAFEADRYIINTYKNAIENDKKLVYLDLDGTNF